MGMQTNQQPAGSEFEETPQDDDHSGIDVTWILRDIHGRSSCVELTFDWIETIIPGNRLPKHVASAATNEA